MFSSSRAQIALSAIDIPWRRAIARASNSIKDHDTDNFLPIATVLQAANRATANSNNMAVRLPSNSKCTTALPRDKDRASTSRRPHLKRSRRRTGDA